MMFPNFFATTNKNKLKEFNEILGIELEQISLDLYEPQALNVEDVVKLKAEDAYKKSGQSVLVEDTGLEIVAWNQFPGALIKWLLESVGNPGLLDMLSIYKDRRAIAKTAVGFCDGKDCRIFVGEVKGTIVNSIATEGGFGWDAVFIPDGHTKTFAEMSCEEKNAISMRKLALEKMKITLGMNPD